MKITAIRQQINRPDRFAIFVEGKYAFSLSEGALLESKLTLNQAVTDKQVGDFKSLADTDVLFAQTLRFLTIRLRTKWEIKTYLKRKKASPARLDTILNKLSNMNLVDDRAFAKAYVANHQLLHPTSRRKLILELRKKHVETEVIQEVLTDEQPDELAALRDIIARKRKQTTYQNDLKLMQYLSRQGFNYGDIKKAMQSE